MGLILRKELPHGVVAVWKTDESNDALAALCTPQEVATARGFNPARAAEFMAWRALLHELAPDAEAYYDDMGGPLLKEDTRHIGVSHTNGYAAVIIGERPCAVDIEYRDRNVSTVAAKFVRADETSFGEEGLLLVWCAKEAMYKLMRRRGIDFLRDMHIEIIDRGSRTIDGSFNGEAVKLGYMLHENICAVFCFG